MPVAARVLEDAQATPSSSPPLGWIAILAALTALGPLSIDMYLPSFPLMARELGVEAGSIQLTLASFFIGMAVGQVFYGPLSDRFGRRAPLMAGLALYGVASVGCALASGVEVLIALRALQALGGCAGMVIARALVRERCGPVEAAKVFSTLILVMGLAPIFAPMLGGLVVEHLGWRAVFWSLAAFGAAALGLVVFALPEPPRAAAAAAVTPGSVLQGYGRLLFKERRFMGHALTGGFAMAGMFAWIAGSPYVVMERYGVSEGRYAWIFGAGAFGLITASQINARLLGRVSLGTLTRAPLAVLALNSLVLLGLGIWGTPPLPVLLGSVYLGLATLGFVNPNSMAQALEPFGRQAGMASALIGCVHFAVATLAGVGIGLWHDGSILPVMALMAAGGLCSFAAHHLMASSA